ncbi:hypothetical protein [Methylobacterium nodulans]|uniref:Uncharacterized protein n=1 Tax=Methylobacterium nodulans (strain LMG 21967 / CNCM I-2342 / ORS 2060) TaxID=460265 RepID=B8IAH8_METNO|nr:hypothetical protein [Methylobacterium nodulans]ACL61023.1 hypothetical protein Mnod_6216 [Methylobacterium nodulans ORS 2060]
MEGALAKIAEQGVVGALLVIMLLVIGYLQRKRDAEAEQRLKEARETLLTTAETNRVLAALKDTMAVLQQSQQSLITTVQTMDLWARSALDKQITRDERVEKTIDAHAGALRELEDVARDSNRLINEMRGQIDRLAAGR